MNGQRLDRYLRELRRSGADRRRPRRAAVRRFPDVVRGKTAERRVHRIAVGRVDRHPRHLAIRQRRRTVVDLLPVGRGREPVRRHEDVAVVVADADDVRLPLSDRDRADVVVLRVTGGSFDRTPVGAALIVRFLDVVGDPERARAGEHAVWVVRIEDERSDEIRRAALGLCDWIGTLALLPTAAVPVVETSVDVVGTGHAAVDAAVNRQVDVFAVERVRIGRIGSGEAAVAALPTRPALRVAAVADRAVVLRTCDDHAARRIRPRAVNLRDPEVVVQRLPSGLALDRGDVLRLVHAAIVAEEDGLVRRAVVIRRKRDRAVIGMRRLRRGLPLADLREVRSAVGGSIDVEAGDEHEVRIRRIDGDDVAVPALIAEVRRAAVRQRVRLAAVEALVDLAAVAIESAVDDARIALRVGERDQPLDRDSAGLMARLAPILGTRAWGISTGRTGWCLILIPRTRILPRSRSSP